MFVFGIMETAAAEVNAQTRSSRMNVSPKFNTF